MDKTLEKGPPCCVVPPMALVPFVSVVHTQKTGEGKAPQNRLTRRPTSGGMENTGTAPFQTVCTVGLLTP